MVWLLSCRAVGRGGVGMARARLSEADRLLLRAVAACLANLAAQQPLKGAFNQPAVNAVISLAGTQARPPAHLVLFFPKP
jgi:hypothetical protein